MVKFTMQKDGKLILGLGISNKNVKLLKKDRPILVDFKEINLMEKIDKVLLFYGDTEEDIFEQLKDMIDASTVINISDKLKH